MLWPGAAVMVLPRWAEEEGGISSGKGPPLCSSIAAFQLRFLSSYPET